MYRWDALFWALVTTHTLSLDDRRTKFILKFLRLIIKLGRRSPPPHNRTAAGPKIFSYLALLHMRAINLKPPYKRDDIYAKGLGKALLAHALVAE
jgi:hypothetical protein